MSHPRRAPAGLAAAVVVGSAAVVAPAVGPVRPALADDPVEVCWVYGITEEEAELGLTSEVECDEEPPAFRLSILMATHYDANDATGAFLLAIAPDCSYRTVFSSTSAWNDRISSTQYGACTNVKHFQHNDFTGNNQLLSGPTGDWDPLNSTLNNQSSSIGYGA